MVTSFCTVGKFALRVTFAVKVMVSFFWALLMASLSVASSLTIQSVSTALAGSVVDSVPAARRMASARREPDV
ncbi:hypothetical protein, partial [Mesorhizobium sp. B2-2-1]|uniref:hypothetical protein n=1 Tax=Mesorhizobium sp. B2-2-1 TaxID=2589965 RepID=UPI001AEF3669